MSRVVGRIKHAGFYLWDTVEMATICFFGLLIVIAVAV